MTEPGIVKSYSGFVRWACVLYSWAMKRIWSLTKEEQCLGQFTVQSVWGHAVKSRRGLSDDLTPPHRECGWGSGMSSSSAEGRLGASVCRTRRGGPWMLGRAWEQCPLLTIWRLVSLPGGLATVLPAEGMRCTIPAVRSEILCFSGCYFDRNCWR